LKAYNSFDRNHHRKFPGKQKEIHLQGSFGRWPISLFYRWIVFIFGYVVRLDVVFLLDGGDWKHTLRQGAVHVEQ